jgi:hypothetical protein
MAYQSLQELRWDMAVDQQHQTDTGTDKVLVAKEDAGAPAWELQYDNPDKTTILHHHGATGVPTTFSDRGDGRWVAQCSECEATLEVRGAAKHH